MQNLTFCTFRGTTFSTLGPRWRWFYRDPRASANSRPPGSGPQPANTYSSWSERRIQILIQMKCRNLSPLVKLLIILVCNRRFILLLKLKFRLWNRTFDGRYRGQCRFYVSVFIHGSGIFIRGIETFVDKSSSKSSNMIEFRARTKTVRLSNSTLQAHLLASWI